VRSCARRRSSHARQGRSSTILARVEHSERDFVQARVLAPSTLRTPDALHLAVVLGDDGRCDGIVTYDQRIIEAAGTLGIRTVSP
jgi:uncharacterized protein